MVTRSNGTLIAFLACAFAVVGLTGIFATYATPVPFERALARQAALDQVLAAADGPDAATVLAQLQDRLADSAAALVPGEDLADRVAAERRRILGRATSEAAATERQLRLLIVVVTLTAGAFGTALLGSALRGG
jgi:hypothetical protein